MDQCLGFCPPPHPTHTDKFNYLEFATTRRVLNKNTSCPKQNGVYTFHGLMLSPPPFLTTCGGHRPVSPSLHLPRVRLAEERIPQWTVFSFGLEEHLFLDLDLYWRQRL